MFKTEAALIAAVREIDIAAAKYLMELMPLPLGGDDSYYLDNVMDWSATPQGHTYWARIEGDLDAIHRGGAPMKKAAKIRMNTFDTSTSQLNLIKDYEQARAAYYEQRYTDLFEAVRAMATPDSEQVLVRLTEAR